MEIEKCSLHKPVLIVEYIQEIVSVSIIYLPLSQMTYLAKQRILSKSSVLCLNGGSDVREDVDPKNVR